MDGEENNIEITDKDDYADVTDFTMRIGIYLYRDLQKKSRIWKGFSTL
jgi:hypothetical protein